MAEACRAAGFIVDRIEVGILVVDREFRIQVWNQFMERHSGLLAEQVLGKNLFDTFPELPKPWLLRKINSVFVLKNFAFTSWEQRPYLFRFAHHRPITGGIDYMQQNSTIMPMQDETGEVNAVCISLFDVTDTAILQRQRADALAALEESNNRDALTGIFNRRYFQERLSAELERVSRYGGEFSLLMFDLDHFKHINDHYGHLGGDAVLRTVAARVTYLLRKPDIFGRYGGEEFVIVLPNTDLEGAHVLAERIRATLAADPVDWDGTPIPVTCSLGVTSWNPSHQRIEAVIHEADLALYHSKKNGRNQVTCFEPAIHTEI